MIKRELAIFLIVGALTVLIDFTVYRVLVQLFTVNIDVAKAAGFLNGTLFAYFANKSCTFSRKTPALGSAWRFAILYTVTLIANISVNALALRFFTLDAASIQFAFIFATGVSAVLNFLGMKYFVFKSQTFSKLL